MNALQELNPQPVTALDLAFPGDVTHLMPASTDIPKDFNNWNNKWNKLAETWFFKGLDISKWTTKDGIDKNQALDHLQVIMGSFQPKHEHKIASVAYLISLWFDVPE